jgi:hypothetical protein
MNHKGSVLVVTLSFITIFTLLGVGSIHHAGQQNVSAEKSQKSLEAFWLAEGGVEKAKDRIRMSPVQLIAESDASINLGNGAYDVYSKADPNCPTCIDRWLIHSQGIVNNQKRTIEAIAAKYDITKVLQTHGPIHDLDKCPMGSLTIDCSLVAENVDFTFESVLNGISKQDLFNNAAQTYNNPKNAGDVDPIEDITVVTLSGGNHSVSLNADNQTSSSAFVIVDTTGVTSNNTPTINIDGNSAFRGIIWIVGEARINGTTDISGTVFVDGSTSETTRVTGDATILFDASAIDEALHNLGGLNLGAPAIISWKEVQS